jgi:hypothetical protein
MPSEPFKIVEIELRAVVGDILAKGILSQAMKKAGANPETVSRDVMRMACDQHIRQSMETFMGGDGASSLVMKLKKKLDAGVS